MKQSPVTINQMLNLLQNIKDQGYGDYGLRWTPSSYDSEGQPLYFIIDIESEPIELCANHDTKFVDIINVNLIAHKPKV